MSRRSGATCRGTSRVLTLPWRPACDCVRATCSTANPWVDFLPPDEAITMARGLNEDLQQFCEDSNGRFYGFGVIPTTSIDGCLEEVNRIKDMDKLRGVVLSTHGRGL